MGEGRSEHGSSRSLVQGEHFFRGIGDWFGRLKERVYEKLFGQQTPTESSEESAVPDDILDLDEFQLRRKLRNREWLRVDLSTVSFDPNRDWGFRVGNWYFIRKDSNNVLEKDNSDESDVQSRITIRPTESFGTEGTLDNADLETMDSSSILSSTIPFTTDAATELITQRTSTGTPTQSSSTQSGSSENLASTIGKDIEDNEANNYVPRRGSVEVLMR
ncbi:uncharacterized protein LOC143216799 isoform X2 [Lasioglossum baleicum]|uniref:uncharacterized protein LOC143216799 isoform X2 n=1 Tax=Lasioglossum baleicum TaxID=434251 RepID=UPI003FCCAD0B